MFKVIENRINSVKMWSSQLNCDNCDQVNENLSPSKYTTSSSGSTSPETKIVNFDCLMQILNYLQIKDKINCRLVCHSWQQAVDKWFNINEKLIVQLQSDQDYCKRKYDKSKCLITSSPMSFQLFHMMMTKFIGLKSLTIINHPISDMHILALTSTCSNLTELHLYSCSTSDDMNSKSYPIMTSYGLHLLVNRYPRLRCFTLRNNNLTEKECQIILTHLNQLVRLDIADNQQLTGESLIVLTPSTKSLCVGNLTSDFYLGKIIESLAKSRAANSLIELELRGGINQVFYELKKFHQLQCLVIKFFCPHDQEHIDVLSPISKMNQLKKLVLHQERCYDDPSAIEESSFKSIVRGCGSLEELVISGEYGWRLRLDDDSIMQMIRWCPMLKSISLTGKENFEFLVFKNKKLTYNKSLSINP